MPNLKIDDLKAIVGAEDGLFRPNRFEIQFLPPGGGGVNGTDLSLLCESTSIPGKQINTFDYPFQSTNNLVKVPNGYSFDDVECIFILTNTFDLKSIFENWMNTIITDDYRLAYAQDYERPVNLYALDQKDERIFQVELENAYPITVNAIPLNMGSNDEIGKLSVTFTFSNYIMTRL